MNVLLENLGLYGSAFAGTIRLFLVAAVGSLLFGTVLAAMRVSPVPILRTFGAGYVNVVRNTPLTLVFFFFAFAYPRLEIVDISFFARACVALIVYTSAFVCEVVRSGVNTVPVGQAEASRALGFTFGQTLGAIVLPQALRAVVPPLTNVEIALLKNTTIAAGLLGVRGGRDLPEPLGEGLQRADRAVVGGAGLPDPRDPADPAAAPARAALERGPVKKEDR